MYYELVIYYTCCSGNISVAKPTLSFVPSLLHSSILEVNLGTLMIHTCAVVMNEKNYVTLSATISMYSRPSSTTHLDLC